MKKLTIKDTGNTPFVNFDPAEGLLNIQGRSTPENPLEYYSNLNGWVNDYVSNPKRETTVRLFFKYINTSSLKCLIEIMKKLMLVSMKGGRLTVEWLYEDGDDDMKELGVDFEDLLHTTFQIIPVQNEE